jgi:hypothetical protein
LPLPPRLKLSSGLQATRLKDNARCIRITIKLKDMMFNQTKVLPLSKHNLAVRVR